MICAMVKLHIYIYIYMICAMVRPTLTKTPSQQGRKMDPVEGARSSGLAF